MAAHKKTITITGSTGAGTGYQVLLKIGESAGASGTNFNIGTATVKFPVKIGDSCDIHFQDMGDNPLPMWVENVTGSTPNRVASIWIKVAANLDTTQQIVCVYGDGIIASGDGNNVFDLFDDFPGTTLNTGKWVQNLGTGGVTVAADELVISGDGSHRAITSVAQFADRRELVGLCLPPNTTQSYVGAFGFRPTSDPLIAFQNDWDSINTSEWVSAGAKVQLAARYAGAYYRFQVRRADGVSSLLIDNTLRATTGSGTSIATAKIALTNVYDNGSLGKVRWIGVKKYIQTEPAFAAAGPEESLYNGRIAGIVRVKGIPLTSGQAILFGESDNVKMAETTVNASGQFEFLGLDKSKQFYVLVKQADTSWEHIVSSRRTPV